MIKSTRRSLGTRVTVQGRGSSKTTTQHVSGSSLFNKIRQPGILPLPSLVCRIQGQGMCIVEKVQDGFTPGTPAEMIEK